MSYKSDDIGEGFMSKYITSMFLIPVEIDYSELNKNEGFFNQEFLKTFNKNFKGLQAVKQGQTLDLLKIERSFIYDGSSSLYDHHHYMTMFGNLIYF